MEYSGKELGKMRKRYKKMILKYSEEKEDIEKAIKEWKLVDEFETDDEYLENISHYDPENPTCICSHHINCVFLIRNKHNLKELINGCDCIKKTNNEEMKEQVDNYIKKKKKIKKIIANEEPTRFNNKLDKLFLEYENKIRDVFNKESANINIFINKCTTKEVNFGRFKGKKYALLPKKYIDWYGKKRKEDSSFFKNDTMDEIYKFCFN